MLDVDVAGHHHRFSVVDGLEFREFIGMPFDQVGEAMQQAFAVHGLHARPIAFLEGAPRRGHCTVDVGRIAQGAVRDDGIARGIAHLEGLAAGGRNPCSVDQQRARLGEKLCIGRCNRRQVVRERVVRRAGDGGAVHVELLGLDESLRPWGSAAASIAVPCHLRYKS